MGGRLCLTWSSTYMHGFVSQTGIRQTWLGLGKLLIKKTIGGQEIYPDVVVDIQTCRRRRALPPPHNALGQTTTGCMKLRGKGTRLITSWPSARGWRQLEHSATSHCKSAGFDLKEDTVPLVNSEVLCESRRQKVMHVTEVERFTSSSVTRWNFTPSFLQMRLKIADLALCFTASCCYRRLVGPHFWNNKGQKHINAWLWVWYPLFHDKGPVIRMAHSL